MGNKDRELAAAVARGERWAAEELTERLLERVRSSCRYMAGARGEWEDMAHNVMIEILKSTPSYSGESSLERWATTVILRTSWRYVRKRERYRQVIDLFRPDSVEQASSRMDGADRLMDRKALRERIDRYLERLNAKQRMCFVMRFLYGYSIKEIAAMTDSREETVKDRIKRARARLKQMMASDGVFSELLEFTSKKNDGDKIKRMQRG
jgi:RNA polymerase sigma factor (sigma-70 family)